MNLFKSIIKYHAESESICNKYTGESEFIHNNCDFFSDFKDYTTILLEHNVSPSYMEFYLAVLQQLLNMAEYSPNDFLNLVMKSFFYVVGPIDLFDLKLNSTWVKKIAFIFKVVSTINMLDTDFIEVNELEEFLIDSEVLSNYINNNQEDMYHNPLFEKILSWYVDNNCIYLQKTITNIEEWNKVVHMYNFSLLDQLNLNVHLTTIKTLFQ